MYRLLKLRKLPAYNSHTLSLPVSSNIFTRTCVFCNHNFVSKAPQDGFLFPFEPSCRTITTNTKTVMHAVSKKRKRNIKKKYAELVEVTEDSSSHKKASVSKLTSKHLTLLAKQPDINLNELFQLKIRKTHSLDNPEHKSNCKQSAVLFIPPEMNRNTVNPAVIKRSIPLFYQLQTSVNCVQKSELLKENNLPINDPSIEKQSSPKSGGLTDLHISNLDIVSESADIAQELDVSINDSELQDKLFQDHCALSPKDNVLEHTYDFNEIDVDSVEVTPLKGKKTEKRKSPWNKKENISREKIAKQKELDFINRSEALTRGVSSYLDVCVNCGLLNRAMSTLSFYRSRAIKGKNNSPKLLDIKPYNIVLQAFAGKANINKVKDILRMMNEDNLKRSIQTYACVFECLGRMPQSDSNLFLLKKYICELNSDGWSANDVLNMCTFVGDQRESVLNAFQIVLPNFEPEYPLPDLCYSCELLRDIKKSQKGNSFQSPAEGVIDEIGLKAAIKEQFAIEARDHIKVKSIDRRETTQENVEYYRAKVKEMEETWRDVLLQAFNRELQCLRAQHTAFPYQSQLNIYPYLKVLDPSVYIDLLIKEIRRLAEGSETYSLSTGLLYRTLGSQVLSRYEVEYKQKLGILNKIENLYEKYCEWYINPSGTSGNTREQWQKLMYSNTKGANVDIGAKQWPSSVLNSLGKFLYNLVLRNAKIDINVMKQNSENPHLLPAFYTLYRNHAKVIKEEMKPHPALARLYRCAASEDLMFDVNLVPMLSPPIPWTTASSGVGGYVMAHSDLVRLPYIAFQQKERMEKALPNQLYPSLDALNQLGSIPWIVNETVLDIVIEVFNNGGSTRLDIPQPPSACPLPTPVTHDMSRERRIKAFQERIMLRRRRGEMYSLWCDALYRLSLANHYRKRVFWLPHNMDFRGRVYPCPPHLNHLGSDMARSLLQFAQGKPLGPKGLDWLMIHLINLTGLKKNDPIHERLVYAKGILPEILDSADNPLKGEMWWARHEEPWQVLATCCEIAHAIRSGNPESYVSHFPVHQDGSCNGLQHYAALGRDKSGAESVNLAPASHPQDVYSCVAALVERERVKDADAGVMIAQTLEGFIRRKVIKQTVMTTVYGVTRYGARLQIARQLKDLDNFPKESVWLASSYLVGKTFESLREMFTSTKEIQDWFTVCARYIAQLCGENVEWVTPLGLPVVQPYVRFNRKEIDSNKSHKINEHFIMDMYARPNVMKQKNAFPPNFIHSLDSSHMMLTSLFCERSGITFVSVHDCFWTHPSSVDVMNKICREQFVALHSQPILEDLSQFLLKTFVFSKSGRDNLDELTKVLLNLPPRGNFKLKEVLKSVYFFS